MFIQLIAQPMLPFHHWGSLKAVLAETLKISITENYTYQNSMLWELMS